MKTRTTTPVAVRGLTAATVLLAAALFGGARPADPITCSVSSVTVVKYIPVESMKSEPSTSLYLEIEPRGARSALFTNLPPVLTSVTDAGGKELLTGQKPMRPEAGRAGRPQTTREELIARIRTTVHPDPFQPVHISPPQGFQLAAFPSAIKELKGHVEVLTGEEALIPVEITETSQMHEISPGVNLVITRITGTKQARFAEFQIIIDKDQSGDGAGLEPVVVGIVRRKGGKEVPGRMYNQLTEKEQPDRYVISSPPPLTLTEGDGTPCNWELRLIRNIKRTSVEFECRDVVMRPQH